MATIFNSETSPFAVLPYVVDIYPNKLVVIEHREYQPIAVLMLKRWPTARQLTRIGAFCSDGQPFAPNGYNRSRQFSFWLHRDTLDLKDADRFTDYCSRLSRLLKLSMAWRDDQPEHWIEHLKSRKWESDFEAAMAYEPYLKE